MADSLRAELLAITGIASAEIDGSVEAPQGVRVQLAAGASPEAVGREVERVLANHGMRTQRAANSVGVESAAESVAVESATPTLVTTSRYPGPPPPPGAGTNGGAAVLPMRAAKEEVVAEPEESPEIEVAPESGGEARSELESVSVEESRDGIAVRVVVGGSSATRHVGASPNGMDAAIVAALLELVGGEAELIAVERSETAGVKIATVLLEVAGSGRQVGSSVVVAGDAYAVAQAAWRALRAQG